MSAFPGAAGAPTAAPPPDVTPAAASTPREACPLCGTPLQADQDWCLRCGAAARTRLAAPPKWKGLVVTLVAVAAISLAVLAVALVKLVG
ncbi:MAG: hypothetical protein ACTHM1_06010 [Solirubrobacteraceae bacterium]